MFSYLYILVSLFLDEWFRDTIHIKMEDAFIKLFDEVKTFVDYPESLIQWKAYYSMLSTFLLEVTQNPFYIKSISSIRSMTTSLP